MEGVKRVCWGVDGVDRYDFRSSRHTTYKQLIELIEQQPRFVQFLLLIAPVASGKTGIMNLAHENLPSYNVICVSLLKHHLSSVETSSNFDEFLLSHCKVNSTDLKGQPATFFDLERPEMWREHKPIIFIFDEIQSVYEAPYAEKFWAHLRRLKQPPLSHNTPVMVKAVIGLGVTREKIVGEGGGTLPIFEKLLGATVLYFKPDEVEELFEDFAQHSRTGPRVTKEIVTEIHNLTYGHCGFVTAIGGGIEINYKNTVEFGRKEWTEFQRMYLYNSLSGTRNVVGLEQALPQPELRDILHWLLEHGSKEEVNVEDRAIKQLLRLGLVRTLDATHGRTATIVFTSPAIQQLYLRRLIGSLAKPNRLAFDNLFDMLTIVLPAMNQPNITRCLSTTVFDSRLVLNEAAWGNHFFAAILPFLPSKVSIQPEYAAADERIAGFPGMDKSKVDFFIHGPELNWAIEFLISEPNSQGSKEVRNSIMIEHCQRFNRASGKYRCLPNGNVSVAVVNITHELPVLSKSEAEEVSELPIELYHLLVDKDSEAFFTLYHRDHEVPLHFGFPCRYDKETRKVTYLQRSELPSFLRGKNKVIDDEEAVEPALKLLRLQPPLPQQPIGPSQQDQPALAAMEFGTPMVGANDQKLQGMLGKLGYLYLLPIFEEAQLTYDALKELSKEDLKELGLPTGPIIAIYNYLRKEGS